MTLTRVNSLFTYRSTVGTQSYLFDIQIDEQGNVTIKNVRTGSGLAQETCNIPAGILDEIQEAQRLVQDLVAETSVATGTLTFTGQTVQTGAIPGGVLNNTAYRVAYSPPDYIVMVTDNPTLTSFDANTSVPYGSVAIPILVPFEVFVTTFATSTTGGTLSFVAVDVGTKSVVFASAMSSSDYRVILSPGGFFSVRVLNKTRLGFDIEIGVTLAGVETVDVGYDVFVG